MVAHRSAVVFAALLSLATSLAAVIAVEGFTASRLETFLADSATTLTRQTAARIAQHALANDRLAMNLLLNGLVEDPNIVSAQFFGADQRVIAVAGQVPVLASPGSPVRDTTDTITLVQPVSFDDVLAGHLRVTWDLSALQAYRARLRLVLAASALCMLLLSVLVAHRLTRPRPVEPAQEDSDIGVRAPVSGPRSQEEPPREAEACAVLVMEPMDLHGLLEQFEAEQINGFLRRAYELVRHSASLYQARHCLIEHNRILVLFTGGGDDEPEAFRAACGGRLILQLLERMRNERTARTDPAVHFHGLVHAGQLHLPAQLGDEVRLDLLDGGKGAVIRMAARMLAHARRDELLLSEAALDHPTVLEKVRFGEARTARTRESEAPLQLFPVTSLAPGYEILQERQGENLLYAARTY